MKKIINWMYYPKNKRPDEITEQIIQAFHAVERDVDSTSHTYKSDEVLQIVRPQLEAIGFAVEKSKHAEDLVSVPVLYGQNGKIEKSFDADGYRAEGQYVVEVEAGRGVVNYQFLKDFFEACTMVDVDKLCIAVRNIYNNKDDFGTVVKFFDAMYASGRLQIPLSSILIIGY